VSYLKPAAYQNGHAGNSSPLDEQQWIVSVINLLEQQPDWDHTAVIIAYDDSDGWYDHLMGKIVNGSATAKDALDGVVNAATARRLFPALIQRPSMRRSAADRGRGCRYW
jgi:phospholipase C